MTESSGSDSASSLGKEDFPSLDLAEAAWSLREDSTRRGQLIRLRAEDPERGRWCPKWV